MPQPNQKPHGTRARGYTPEEKELLKEVSRQRIWQLRKQKEGKCASCGEENDGPYKDRCLACKAKQVEQSRKPGHQQWQPGSRGRKPLWYLAQSK